jgi:hypothetical protein
MGLGWFDWTAGSLNLSRLRGRSARSAGWGLSPPRESLRGDTPTPALTPALPRKRERGRTSLVVTTKIDPIVLYVAIGAPSGLTGCGWPSSSIET